MDQNNKKRVREEDENKKGFSKKQLMKQENGFDDFKDDQYSSCYKTSESDLTFGVFDFPWLKDGVVSKTEDWKFEDVFLSPLADISTNGIEFSFPESLLDFPEEKLEEKLCLPIEDDHDLDETDLTLDCIWSSLLNQPLQQPN